MPQAWIERRLTRLKHGVSDLCYDSVAVEQRVCIIINNELYACLMCTPTHLGELALGFLWSSGLLEASGELPNAEIHETLGEIRFNLGHVHSPHSRQHTLFSGCGRALMRDAQPELCAEPDETTFFWEHVTEASSHLAGGGSLFERTGGTHAVGFYREGSFLAIREDIGRHNALDKIGGFLLQNGIPGRSGMLVSTGRTSLDSVMKAVRFGVRLVVSRGAPTSAAISLASQCNLTLVGFARASRMNIYTAPERIVTRDSL